MFFILQAPSDKFAQGSILEMLENLDQVPNAHRTKIRNVGGGYVSICHSVHDQVRGIGSVKKGLSLKCKTSKG